jgi:hypothetical protein
VQLQPTKHWRIRGMTYTFMLALAVFAMTISGYE